MNPLLAVVAILLGAAAMRWSGALASGILGRRRPIDSSRLGPERITTIAMGAGLLLLGLLGLTGILH